MKQQILVSAAAMLAAVAILSGQEQEKSFQVFGKTKAKTGISFRFGETVKGRPFSATEEQHSLQVLSDGTRIETSQTSQVYRNGEGRMVVKPVSGSPAPKWISVNGVDGMVILRSQNFLNEQSANRSAEGPQTTENLGVQSVNGVTARGERTVTTIPVGAIGNNREIRVVDERWYSDDLQLLIKSSNSDPRFGDTTYELKNILRGEPDPAVFTIQPPGGRGGRGGGRGTTK